MLKTLGEKLKKLRLDHGLTQEEMCEIFEEYGYLNANKGMVSHWENGKTIPNSKYVLSYARYFNIDANYLYGLVKERRRLDKLISMEDITLYKEIAKVREKDLVLKIVKKIAKQDREYLEYLYDTL